MQEKKMYQKGAKILGVGFSLTKCDPTRAVAFQLHPLSTHTLDKFMAVTSTSPVLANFDPQLIECASVGCGHLNQFLAAVHDELVVPEEFKNNEDLMGKGGGHKLDKLNIIKRDGKDLGMVLERGLEWTVVNYRIEVKFPSSLRSSKKL